MWHKNVSLIFLQVLSLYKIFLVFFCSYRQCFFSLHLKLIIKLSKPGAPKPCITNRTVLPFTKKNTNNFQTQLSVDHLIADRSRKFIWAEMSYLSMWWEQASEARRGNLKKVVDGKQLEIVTGGWVMNDEANTHYFAMIDQLIEGYLYCCWFVSAQFLLEVSFCV